MSIKDRLAEIVGQDNVSDAPEAIELCSRDFSLSPPGLFSCLAQPRTAEEVQKIIQLANELKFPVTPSSSGVHFYGNAIPRMSGVLLDLRRMNSIKEIDETSRVAHLEPGVTWEQFQTALDIDPDFHNAAVGLATVKRQININRAKTAILLTAISLVICISIIFLARHRHRGRIAVDDEDNSEGS